MFYLKWTAGGEEIQAPYSSEDEALAQAVHDEEFSAGLDPIGVFNVEGTKLLEIDGKQTAEYTEAVAVALEGVEEVVDK